MNAEFKRRQLDYNFSQVVWIATKEKTRNLH
jgi:hypothetical protein